MKFPASRYILVEAVFIVGETLECKFGELNHSNTLEILIYSDAITKQQNRGVRLGLKCSCMASHL